MLMVLTKKKKKVVLFVLWKAHLRLFYTCDDSLWPITHVLISNFPPKGSLLIDCGPKGHFRALITSYIVRESSRYGLGSRTHNVIWLKRFSGRRWHSYDISFVGRSVYGGDLDGAGVAETHSACKNGTIALENWIFTRTKYSGFCAYNY